MSTGIILKDSPINLGPFRTGISLPVAATNLTYSSLNTGIYSSYSGDNTSNDTLGNFNAINHNLAYLPGVTNNAFSLNGSNAYAELPQNSHNFLDSFTVAFSYYLNTAPTTTSYIFSNYSTSGVSRGFRIGITSSRALSVTAYYQGTNYVAITTASGSVPIGTWVKIKFVYNLTAGNCKIYVDNTLLGTDNSIAALNYNSPSYPSFGASKYTSSLVEGYCNGLIDNVNTWNRALTDAELTELNTNPVYPFSALPSCAVIVNDKLRYGYGSSNIYTVPFDGLYNYSVGMYIIPKSELISPKQITGIEWQTGGYATPFTYSAVDVYLAHTNLVDFSTVQPLADMSNIPMTDLTKVVNAQPFAISSNGWNGLDFDTNFCYNGTDNILVVTYNNDGSGSSSYGYHESVSTTKYSSAYYYSAGLITNQLCSRQYYYPNTKLKY